MLILTESTGEMSRLFNLDMQLINDTILLACAMFLLFLAMSYLLFNPVRKMLQDRQERLKSELDDAANDKESAAALKAEYEAKLATADKEVEAILSEARKKAIANESRIIAEAKEEAARIIAQAEKEAELEKKRVAAEVKQEMISVASLMAAKVISAQVNTSIQDELVEETLKEMGDTTWRS